MTKQAQRIEPQLEHKLELKQLNETLLNHKFVLLRNEASPQSRQPNIIKLDINSQNIIKWSNKQRCFVPQHDKIEKKYK